MRASQSTLYLGAERMEAQSRACGQQPYTLTVLLGKEWRRTEMGEPGEL